MRTHSTISSSRRISRSTQLAKITVTTWLWWRTVGESRPGAPRIPISRHRSTRSLAPFTMVLLAYHHPLSYQKLCFLSGSAATEVVLSRLRPRSRVVEVPAAFPRSKCSALPGIGVTHLAAQIRLDNFQLVQCFAQASALTGASISITKFPFPVAGKSP